MGKGKGLMSGQAAIYKGAFTGNYGKSGVSGGLKNMYGDISGQNGIADAASKSAMAAEAEARGQRAQSIFEGHRIEGEAMDLAKASPQEMQAYEQSLKAAGTQLDADQRLMASIDPAIMEASHQVLSLLKGEQSGIGNAQGTMRAQQRQQMVDSLKSQYGPGAESSSIGQRALRQFDMETANLSGQSRSGELSSLFGVINNRPNMINSGNMFNAAGNNYAQLQNRQLNAKLQSGNIFMNALSGGNAAVMQNVGSQYVGPMMEARQNAQLFNTGATILGTMYGGPAGGKAANSMTNPGTQAGGNYLDTSRMA